MATYYFRNVGTAWNSNTSWSTTSSSGASAGVIPTALDAVIFDAGSANACPVTTTNGVCLTLTTTGWTGTITLNVNLRVSGSITLSATTTFAGVGYLGAIATGTITSNAVSIPYLLVGTGTAMTLTLADNLNVVKYQLSDSTTNVTYTINGNTMNVSGDVIFIGYSTGTLQNGTTIFNFNGTSNIGNIILNNFTWSSPITINTSGTITFNAGFAFGGNAFTYVAGTVDMLKNLCLFRIGGTCTFSPGPIVFSTWQVINNPIITLGSDVITRNLYFLHTGTFTTTINGASFKVYVGEPNGNIGILTVSPAGSSAVAGTATIEFTGKGGIGTWQGNGGRSMNWNINININTQGTLYIYTRASSSVNQDLILFGGGKTFAYYCGTVITRSLFYIPSFGWANFVKGAWLQVATTSTLIGFNKIAWGRIQMPGGGTVTMDEFPCGNANIQTIMYSSTGANYTINLTGTNSERIAQFIEVRNCTLGTTSRNKVIVTHPKGNAGGNSGLRFGDMMGHGIPKSLEINQIKYKNGREIAYGAMGLVADPNFSSI